MSAPAPWVQSEEELQAYAAWERAEAAAPPKHE